MKIKAGRRPKFDHITRLAVHFSSNRSSWLAKIQQAPKSSRLVFAQLLFNTLRVSFPFRNHLLLVPPRLHWNIFEWNNNFFEDTRFVYTKTAKTCTKTHENVSIQKRNRKWKLSKTQQTKCSVSCYLSVAKGLSALDPDSIHISLTPQSSRTKLDRNWINPLRSCPHFDPVRTTRTKLETVRTQGPIMVVC